MTYEKDYYAILQVSRNTTQDDIENAYKRLSATYDPARSSKKRAADRRAEVEAAYAVLSDRQRRRRYDRAGARSARPAGFFSSPVVLVGSGIAFVAAVSALVIVLVLGGSSGSTAVTPSPSASGTPAPSPTRTAPATPPAVAGATTTLPDGLQYIVITPGSGDPVQAGEIVRLDYSGWLQDAGTLFDTSYSTGQPFIFTVGAGSVIKGWDEGVIGMLPGEKRRLIVPASLGYGDAGSPPKIPAGATLIFDIELYGATTPTPFGQTVAPTPPPSPPEVSGTPTTLPDGLQYIIVQEGSGDPLPAEAFTTVNYSGWVKDSGVLFDSSYNPGRQPLEFALGFQKVIKGWDEGLVGMRPGEKRRLIIPPSLGYGANVRGLIPANSTLIFDVDLISWTPITSPTPSP